MPTGPSPVANAPGAAPMMTPQPPDGQTANAKVDVLMGIKMLERGIPAFGSTSKEGRALMKAVLALTKEFGADEEKSEELMPAEIRQLLQGLAGPGQPPTPPAGGPPGAGAGPPPPMQQPG